MSVLVSSALGADVGCHTLLCLLFFWFAYTDPHPQKPNHPPLFLMFCNYSKANKQAKATNISVIVVSVVITGNLQEPETGYTQVLEIHVQ